ASTRNNSATVPMPGLPGAASTAVTPGSRDRARARACSRAPEPITSTRTDDRLRDRPPHEIGTATRTGNSFGIGQIDGAHPLLCLFLVPPVGAMSVDETLT